MLWQMDARRQLALTICDCFTRYNFDGTVAYVVDGFDDSEVESKLISRGAVLYNGTMSPGKSNVLGLTSGQINSCW